MDIKRVSESLLSYGVEPTSLILDRLQRAAHFALYGDDNGYVPHGPECDCESCQHERAADIAREGER